MPSRGTVVHGISHYIVGVAVARKHVAQPGVCQMMQVIETRAREVHMTGLGRVSHVAALSQWTEWLGLLRADSDEPLCTQFHRASMPSRGTVVHGISHYIVGVAVARKHVSQPGVCQMMQVIETRAREVHMTGLGRVSHVAALSQWAEWPLPFEPADSDNPFAHNSTEPPCLQSVQCSCNRPVVVEVAMARKYVSQPGVCQRMQAIGKSK